MLYHVTPLPAPLRSVLPLALLLPLRPGSHARRGAPATQPRRLRYGSSSSDSLNSGLTVIPCADRSDPIAAVAMTFPVGSAREIEGRTGFAHLFEHLFFLHWSTWVQADATS